MKNQNVVPEWEKQSSEIKSDRSPLGCPAKRTNECTWVDMWALIPYFLPVFLIPLVLWRKSKLYMPLRNRVDMLWRKWHYLSADQEVFKPTSAKKLGQNPSHQNPKERGVFCKSTFRHLFLLSPELRTCRWPHLLDCKNLILHQVINRLLHTGWWPD